MGWQHIYEYRSGKFTLNDYNFEQPTNSLVATTPTTVSLPNISAYEVFDYPGIYTDTGRGSTLAGIRVEADEAPYDVVSARSTYRTFTPGGQFTVTQHSDQSEVNQTFVITSITHSSLERDAYRNRFEAIPATVVYRPGVVTPKPMIRGTQTAVVVGSSGEEIWPDKYGRIKVQFYWDRLGTNDENSSCWIRCAQPWTGNAWASCFCRESARKWWSASWRGIPTSLWSSASSPMRMRCRPTPCLTIKPAVTSRHTLPRGGGGFNEIRFEDLKKSEEIYIHAQKDLNSVVENNETLTVGSSNAADGSQTISIYKNRTLTVQTGNESLTIQQATGRWRSTRATIR